MEDNPPSGEEVSHDPEGSTRQKHLELPGTAGGAGGEGSAAVPQEDHGNNLSPVGGQGSSDSELSARPAAADGHSSESTASPASGAEPAAEPVGEEAEAAAQEAAAVHPTGGAGMEVSAGEGSSDGGPQEAEAEQAGTPADAEAPAAATGGLLLVHGG